MKIFTKILLIIWLIFSIFIINWYAGTVDIEWLWNDFEKVKKVSNYSGSIDENINIVKEVEKKWINILHIFKTLLQWILLIYIIYIGIQMVISMWTDEDKLSKWKNQLWYSLVAIMFINIPWTIYRVINSEHKWSNISDLHNNESTSWTNLFINNSSWHDWLWTLLNNIVSFIEVIIFWIAIFTIVMHWIKIMSARWREEKITEAKSKILYSLYAWIFVWFIDAWRRLAMSGSMNDWWQIFWKFSKIALLFAWPVAIFFLTLAWYYYITANWDENKTKKAKSIIVNTLIWIILLWAMFTFLKDLANF